MSQNQDQRVKKIEELGSNLGLKVLPKFKESNLGLEVLPKFKESNLGLKVLPKFKELPGHKFEKT